MHLPKSTSLGIFFLTATLIGLGSLLGTASPTVAQSATIDDRKPLLAFRCGGGGDLIRISISPAQRQSQDPLVVKTANPTINIIEPASQTSARSYDDLRINARLRNTDGSPFSNNNISTGRNFDLQPITTQVSLLEEGKSLTPNVVYQLFLQVRCFSISNRSPQSPSSAMFTIEYRP